MNLITVCTWTPRNPKSHCFLCFFNFCSKNRWSTKELHRITKEFHLDRAPEEVLPPNPRRKWTQSAQASSLPASQIQSEGCCWRCLFFLKWISNSFCFKKNTSRETSAKPCLAQLRHWHRSLELMSPRKLIRFQCGHVFVLSWRGPFQFVNLWNCESIILILFFECYLSKNVVPLYKYHKSL